MEKVSHRGDTAPLCLVGTPSMFVHEALRPPVLGADRSVLAPLLGCDVFPDVQHRESHDTLVEFPFSDCPMRGRGADSLLHIMHHYPPKIELSFLPLQTPYIFVLVGHGLVPP